MKLIVIDIDKIKLPQDIKEKLNEAKICTLTRTDFGKKTLVKLPKHNPRVLNRQEWYRGAIFGCHTDDQELKYENKLMRELLNEIEWFRVGVILRRDKACKILLKLLGR